MKVDSVSLHGALSGGVHYVLPHFQRQYTWEIHNWKDLLEDVQRIYGYFDEQKPPEHFMGALVVVNDGTMGVSIPAYKLVDGQQRLTTISLMLRALYELTTDEKLRRRIYKYLVNDDEDELVRYKLLPTQKNSDRDTFIRVIEGHVAEHEPDKTPSVIDNAYRFILRALRRWIENEGYEPERIFKIISSCLQFVFIKIDEQERPYAIFESLNAKGKPLTQTDLVRNYIAMKLPGKQQEHVFNQYWAKIDNLLSEDRKVARIGELTAFLRHYIAFRTGTVEREDMIYIRFRDSMEKDHGTPELFEQELRTLHQFAVWYDRLIRPEREPDSHLREALTRLNILESTTAYPLLLAAYEAYHDRRLSLQGFLDGLKVLENYLVRRMLVGDNAYTNRMFPSIIKHLTYVNYPESLRRLLAGRRFIPDNRLRQELPNRPLYDRTAQNRLVFIFNEIERYLGRSIDGHGMLAGKPTLEHILPQKPSSSWKEELGEHLDEAHTEYLHTIGNLTLVTQDWNSGELSNHSFAHKLERLGKHALQLNKKYFEAFSGNWDADAIRQRADALIDIILKIWPPFGDEQEADGDSYFPPVSVKGTKALGLMFLGDEYPLKSWRDSAITMCELGIKNNIDFTLVTEQAARYFSESEGIRTRPLSNGIYISTDLTADDALRICRVVGDILDLEEGKEWLPLYTHYGKTGE